MEPRVYFIISSYHGLHFSRLVTQDLNGPLVDKRDNCICFPIGLTQPQGWTRNTTCQDPESYNEEAEESEARRAEDKKRFSPQTQNDLKNEHFSAQVNLFAYC